MFLKGKAMTVDEAIEQAFSGEFAKAYKAQCESTKARVWEVSMSSHKSSGGMSGFKRSTLLRAMEILAANQQR